MTLTNCSISGSQYIEFCTPLEASCINCGIPMARFIPHRDYWCGQCGLVVYKNIFGIYKIGTMKPTLAKDCVE
jgi:ribosomal protein S27AE